MDAGGHYNNNSFYISWEHNRYLFVTMQRTSLKLVGAFAQIVEYRPFCKYERNGMITVEWDKYVSDRFDILRRDEEACNITLLQI